MRKQLVDSLSTNFYKLDDHDNVTYGPVEMQIYFHSLISQYYSKVFRVDQMYNFYCFNLPENRKGDIDKNDLVAVDESVFQLYTKIKKIVVPKGMKPGMKINKNYKVVTVIRAFTG